jgi:DNA-3-methyladenine glycosylase II
MSDAQPSFPTPQTIAAARAALAAADPALARLDAVTPPFEWRARGPGFESLVRLIVAQQVSLASAEAIWRRLAAGLGEVTPAAVAAAEVEELRGLGLSLPKARYVKALAEEVGAGQFSFSGLRSLEDEDAMRRLTGLLGIGLWTAETYLMFCEGRLDIFPGGDVALQEAMRWTDRAEVRPTREQAYRRAEAWRPYRGVAAHLLWRCYGMVRNREIAPFV